MGKDAIFSQIYQQRRDRLADAIVDDMFVEPAEVSMTVSCFLQQLVLQQRVQHARTTHTHRIVYVQSQNSNLQQEWHPLLQTGDIPSIPPFTENVLNAASLDAVNIWIGNETSVTSLHKDPYENIYAVLDGEKVFTLFPPTDYPFLYGNF